MTVYKIELIRECLKNLIIISSTKKNFKEKLVNKYFEKKITKCTYISFFKEFVNDFFYYDIFRSKLVFKLLKVRYFKE